MSSLYFKKGFNSPSYHHTPHWPPLLSTHLSTCHLGGNKTRAHVHTELCQLCFFHWKIPSSHSHNAAPLSPPSRCRGLLQEWTWHGVDSIVLWWGVCLPGSVLERGKRKVRSHPAKSTVKRDISSSNMPESSSVCCCVCCLTHSGGLTGISLCFFYTAMCNVKKECKFDASHFIVTHVFLFINFKGMRVCSRERRRGDVIKYKDDVIKNWWWTRHRNKSGPSYEPPPLEMIYLDYIYLCLLLK